MGRVALLSVAAVLLAAEPAAAALPDLTVPGARDTTPVVLTGAQLGSWAAPSNTTVQPPLMDLADCPYTVNPEGFGDPTEEGAGGLTSGFEQDCPDAYDPHNHYADPVVDTGAALGEGTPVGRLLGLRWDAVRGRFTQIPFQVDERFARYLDNSASGFAIYSGQDAHTTYAYQREGFRWDAEAPDDPCRARPSSPAAGDPVRGLDDDDELAFMASDAGPQAPAGAPLPAGVEALRPVTLVDPLDRGAPPRYAYIARTAAQGAPKPRYTSRNGYVHYRRDANADTYAFSESSYDTYGNAKVGAYCDADGNVVGEGRRRPRDTATITTSRYRFRYDGRWLMTRVEISPDGGATYGPDLVDRWKARAFQQSPEADTPCCGYEEEDNNWGGSSTLLGEKVGPVRAIRETWGADSGTNVIRRETFYRDEVRQKTWLRVHPIPPIDGIYAQWDFNAGRVTTYSNSRGSHLIDGRDDEAYGNGVVDVPDLTFGDPNAGTDWSLVSGPNGSIVDRITVDPPAATPGGLAQSVLAVPYYRDDACFDDGTGDDPGPDLGRRKDPEPRTRADGTPRECWSPDKGLPEAGSDRFFQGAIATHGLHLLLVAESDNARQTVPLTEIVNEWQMVMLPGERPPADGERYGRALEKPLLVAVGPPRG